MEHLKHKDKKNENHMKTETIGYNLPKTYIKCFLNNNIKMRKKKIL